MALIKLEDLLKESSIDLTKLGRIYVTPQGKVPYYNSLDGVNTFSVNATVKAIDTVILSQDNKSYTNAENFVVSLNKDGSISVLTDKSKDVYEAMTQPHTFEFPDGVSDAKKLLTGFKLFLDGNYDGLYGSYVASVEVEQEAATPVVPTFVLSSTNVSGKVGDKPVVTISGITPSSLNASNITVANTGKSGNVTVVNDNAGNLTFTLVKEGSDSIDVSLSGTGTTTATQTISFTITAS